MAVWILVCPLLAALLCAVFAGGAPRLGLFSGVAIAVSGAACATYAYINGMSLRLPNIDILHTSYIDMALGGEIAPDRICWILAIFALVALLQASFLTPEIGAKISHRDAWRAALIWFVLFANVVMLSAQNLLHLLVGWHLVSLAVFVALGFNYRKSSARGASLTGFIIQRFADVALTLGLIALILQNDSAEFISETAADEAVATPWCTGLIIVALIAKTAQPLFHAWLVRAADLALPALCALMIAGPFSAGVFALHILLPVLKMTPELTFLGIISTASAFLLSLFAATQILCARGWIFAATAQTAMVLASLSWGGDGSAMALISACAFALIALATTSATRAMEGEKDLRYLGGLGRKMPFSFLAMTFGVLCVIVAIGHLPVPSGSLPHMIMACGPAFILGLAVVRFMFLLFAGRERGHKHAHDTGHDAVHSRLRESPLSVLLPMLPLIVMPLFFVDVMIVEESAPALAATCGGFVGLASALWRGTTAHRSTLAEILSDGLFIIPLTRALNERLVAPLGNLVSPDFSRFLTAEQRRQDDPLPRGAGQFAMWIGLSCLAVLAWVWWETK